MLENNVIFPSFEAVQSLFSGYSTISNNSALQHKLYELIDASFLSIFESKGIREIYNQILLEYYPNECCIKSQFVNQILLKGKSDIGIYEFPVANSRADLCKINGTSIAYEIKTDLDNFSRLTKQLNDYYSIFEQVYVICSSHKLKRISEIIPDECGIYTYQLNRQGRYHFKLSRKAIRSNRLNPYAQLQLLRKNEFCSFSRFDISSCSKASAINSILEHYDCAYINEQFKRILKQRYGKQWQFLKEHHMQILEIDYQWFYKNMICPTTIYSERKQR